MSDSQHSTLHKAIERAANLVLAPFGASIEIVREAGVAYRVRDDGQIVPGGPYRVTARGEVREPEEPEDPVEPEPPPIEPDPPEDPGEPAELVIDPEELELEVGESAPLLATVYDQDGREVLVEVEWRHHDRGAVAVVDVAGTVTAVAPGETSVTVRWLPDGGWEAARVTVRAEGEPDPPKDPIDPIPPIEPDPPGDPGEPSERPNDPGFPDRFAIHDFSYMPVEIGSIEASDFGFVRVWGVGGAPHSELRRNYLGQLGYEGLTGSVPASVPVVTHGPQAPHGMDNVLRVRMPVGMGTSSGTATGNGGSTEYHPVQSTTGLEFRRVYCHVWFCLEGHDYPHPDTQEIQRVVCHAGYRMTQEIALDRPPNNYYYLIHRTGAAPKRNAITGECSAGLGPYDFGFAGGERNGQGYEPITHGTMQVGSPSTVRNPSDAPHCTGTSEDYSNWLTGNNKGWSTRGQNTCQAHATAWGPGCVIQVGRWHRLETLLNFGTPDTPDGQLYYWLDGQLQAYVDGVRMLSRVWEGWNGLYPLKGYVRKALRMMYHPMGGIQKPIEDYISFADLYMTGVEF